MHRDLDVNQQSASYRKSPSNDTQLYSTLLYLNFLSFSFWSWSNNVQLGERIYDLVVA